MKKKIFVVALCALALTGCGKSIPTLENGQEAFVEFGNGDMISVDEIYDELKDNYALSVVINKIDMKILKEEYADKLEDMESYVSYLETSLKANYTTDGVFDEDTMLQQLSYYGYGSLDDYLDAQRLNYLKDLAETDYAKTLVTDKEIESYYKTDVVGDISAVHILVKPASDSDEDKATAEEKAEEIIAAIQADVKSGTSVADAFAKYKDDTSVTYQDLGSFNKGDMVEAFETAAYALKVNEYTTTPVETTYGYHVILKTGESEKASLEDSRESIIEELASTKKEEDSKIEVNTMMALRKEYGVKIDDSEISDKYDKYMNYLINQDDEE